MCVSHPLSSCELPVCGGGHSPCAAHSSQVIASPSAASTGCEGRVARAVWSLLFYERDPWYTSIQGPETRLSSRRTWARGCPAREAAPRAWASARGRLQRCTQLCAHDGHWAWAWAWAWTQAARTPCNREHAQSTGVQAALCTMGDTGVGCTVRIAARTGGIPAAYRVGREAGEALPNAWRTVPEDEARPTARREAARAGARGGG